MPVATQQCSQDATDCGRSGGPAEALMLSVPEPSPQDYRLAIEAIEGCADDQVVAAPRALLHSAADDPDRLDLVVVALAQCANFVIEDVARRRGRDYVRILRQSVGANRNEARQIRDFETQVNLAASICHDVQRGIFDRGLLALSAGDRVRRSSQRPAGTTRVPSDGRTRAETHATRKDDCRGRSTGEREAPDPRGRLRDQKEGEGPYWDARAEPRNFKTHPRNVREICSRPEKSGDAPPTTSAAILADRSERPTLP